MNKFHIGLLLLSVLSLTSSKRVVRDSYDEVDRGDKFIDDFIRDMTYENGHEYDPYVLEDSVVNFSKKVMFVNVTGEAKLHKGYITGLKSLHRADQCKVKERDGRLFVSADLGAGVLNYDDTVKFMNFGPTISIHGEIQYVEIFMEFSVDAKSGKDGVLENFSIHELKGMQVKITGLGPMNWAANYLISGVTAIFGGSIRKMIESSVRKYLEERLPDYQFPVDEPETESPEIVPPEVVDPETDAPEVVDPETDAPEVVDPETDAPEVVDPETDAPEVVDPETDAPEVVDPETDAPEVVDPETDAPEVVDPETDAPEVVDPETDAPEVEDPETDAPDVEEPAAEIFAKKSVQSVEFV